MSYRNPASQIQQESQHDKLIREGIALLNRASGAEGAMGLQLLDDAIAKFTMARAIEKSLDASYYLGSSTFRKAELLDEPKVRLELAQQAIPHFEHVLQLSDDMSATAILGEVHYCCAMLLEDKSLQCKHFDETLRLYDSFDERMVAAGIEDDLRLNTLMYYKATLERRAFLAEGEERKGLLVKALLAAETSIAINPNDIEQRYNYPNALVKLGSACKDFAERQMYLEKAEAESRRLIDDLPSFDKSHPFFVVGDDWTPKYIEYDHVCVLALLGRKDEAISELEVLVNARDIPWWKIDTDEDLDPIRECQGFKALEKLR